METARFHVLRFWSCRAQYDSSSLLCTEGLLWTVLDQLFLSATTAKDTMRVALSVWQVEGAVAFDLCAGQPCAIGVHSDTDSGDSDASVDSYGSAHMRAIAVEVTTAEEAATLLRAAM